MRSRKVTVHPVCWLAPMLLAAGCSDYGGSGDEQPAGIAQGLTVTGTVCTEPTSSLRFPVKVLFVVDCSQSMAITDPAPGGGLPARARAILRVIDGAGPGDDLSAGIVRFANDSWITTQQDTDGDGVTDQWGFLPSDLVPPGALEALTAAGGGTDYQGALALAEEVLAADMRAARSAELSRSRYLVVFVTDGMPFPAEPDRDYNTPASVGRALQESLRLLAARYQPADLVFHTVYLAANTPNDIREETERLLTGLAEIGGGIHRTFDTADALGFGHIDFGSAGRAHLSMLGENAFLVVNRSAPVPCRPKAADSDLDGLCNEVESTLGTALDRADTDGDGLSDLVEVRFSNHGLDPLLPDDGFCALEEDRVDRDGDGLRDCEEYLAGTDPLSFDTDGDGIPDRLELVRGTNPLHDETGTDIDFDGRTTPEEIAAHLDPHAADEDACVQAAITYQIEVTGTEDGGTCYHFSAGPIPLAPGTAANHIEVIAGQATAGIPAAPAVFRVARFQVDPAEPSRLVELSRGAFRRPAPTVCQTDRDCPPALACATGAGVCTGPACTGDPDCATDLGFTCRPAADGASPRCVDWPAP